MCEASSKGHGANKRVESRADIVPKHNGVQKPKVASPSCDHVLADHLRLVLLNIKTYLLQKMRKRRNRLHPSLRPSHPVLPQVITVQLLRHVRRLPMLAAVLACDYVRSGKKDVQVRWREMGLEVSTRHGVLNLRPCGAGLVAVLRDEGE